MMNVADSNKSEKPADLYDLTKSFIWSIIRTGPSEPNHMKPWLNHIELNYQRPKRVENAMDLECCTNLHK